MTVRFLSEAASDVVLAREWYDGQRPGLGDGFVQSLERVVDLLSDLPEAFLIAVGLRRALLGRFPYALYYRVGGDLVDVIACLHLLSVRGARDGRPPRGSELKASQAAISAVEAILDRCDIVPPGNAPSPLWLRDPDDERVLADAISAGVEILVSGDQDLLAAAKDSPIRILSPRAFLTPARGGTR